MSGMVVLYLHSLSVQRESRRLWKCSSTGLWDPVHRFEVSVKVFIDGVTGNPDPSVKGGWDSALTPNLNLSGTFDRTQIDLPFGLKTHVSHKMFTSRVISNQSWVHGHSLLVSLSWSSRSSWLKGTILTSLLRPDI